ncbi:hypothetical protein [Arthrobacter sp. YN]|uniref:hypothetical protein n=1 Tax=Arthrobacter sp. YN TaxID=2020486 RepID=UPI000B5EB8A0|nr:hypothetical protein [Arthrobacter sp. YN]ASN20117.1 hypothetical protein CGK93_10890 [Arthrobacter sp. YN]
MRDRLLIEQTEALEPASDPYDNLAITLRVSGRQWRRPGQAEARGLQLRGNKAVDHEQQDTTIRP